MPATEPMMMPAMVPPSMQPQSPPPPEDWRGCRGDGEDFAVVNDRGSFWILLVQGSGEFRGSSEAYHGSDVG